MISDVRLELSSYLGVSIVTEKVGTPESKLSRREWKLVLESVDLGDLWYSVFFRILVIFCEQYVDLQF